MDSTEFIAIAELIRQQIATAPNEHRWDNSVSERLLESFNNQGMRLFGLAGPLFQFGDRNGASEIAPSNDHRRCPDSMKIYTVHWRKPFDGGYGYRIISVWLQPVASDRFVKTEYGDSDSQKRAVNAIDDWIGFAKLSSEQQRSFQDAYEDQSLLTSKTEPVRNEKTGLTLRQIANEVFEMNATEATNSATRWGKNRDLVDCVVGKSNTKGSPNLYRYPAILHKLAEIGEISETALTRCLSSLKPQLKRIES